MNRIGSGVPDPVQQPVIAAEAAFILRIMHHGHSPDAKHLHKMSLIQKIDTHKPEAGVPDLFCSHIADLEDPVPHRMVISGIALSAQPAHGLHCGFPEPDTESGCSAVFVVAAHNTYLHAAMKLRAKIQ
ncbi:hypothetical protein D3C75_610880 [compost metagenome]